MKNFFTDHLRKSRQTYFEHFRFAFLTGIRLSISVPFFFIHSVIPFFQIPKPFCCAGIVEALDERASRSEYEGKK